VPGRRPRGGAFRQPGDHIGRQHGLRVGQQGGLAAGATRQSLEQSVLRQSGIRRPLDGAQIERFLSLTCIE
jgi:hypothetical protein